jgi:hypothetical protein
MREMAGIPKRGAAQCRARSGLFSVNESSEAARMSARTHQTSALPVGIPSRTLPSSPLEILERRH